MADLVKEAKYRLGDLWFKKIQADETSMLYKKNGKLFFTHKGETIADSQSNPGSWPGIRRNIIPDLDFIISIHREDIKIPVSLDDRASPDNGYIFSFARSTGEDGVGLLNDHWFHRNHLHPSTRDEFLLATVHNFPIDRAKRIIEKKNSKQDMEVYIDWAKQYLNNPELLDIESLTMNIIKQAILNLKKFKDKDPILFWGGIKTGGFNRFQVEHGYHEKAVERDKIVEYFENNPSNYVNMSFENFPPGDQYDKGHHNIGMCTMDYANTTHKYLIELQGNDYASNVWWVYGTDCVVFRPDWIKSNTAWDCHLEPWVHYVPFDHANYEDLVDKIKWCEKNTDKCEAIIKEANTLNNLMHNKQHVQEVYKHMLPKIKHNLIFT